MGLLLVQPHLEHASINEKTRVQQSNEGVSTNKRCVKNTIQVDVGEATAGGLFGLCTDM